MLILDNCEHLIDAAAALAARLLADCPGVRVLATSREPLGIGGETLYPVGPLPAPPAVPRAAGTGRARQFLSGGAPVRGPGRRCPPQFHAQLRQRGRRGADLPGARRHAAGHRACRPLAPHAGARPAGRAAGCERLDDRFALLTGGSRTAQPRHQTLRAVVDWSWHLLSEPERTLARRLAVFPAGATLAAAEQVCADPTPNETPSSEGQKTVSADVLPRASVLPALSGLVGKSIIAMADTPGGCAPRYRMLETVRAYGLERLAEAGEESATRDAFARYYLDFAETADPLLRAAGQIRWFRELLAEQDNVNAALRWAIGRRDSAPRCGSSGPLATTGSSAGTARATSWPARCWRWRHRNRRPSGPPRRG